MDSVTSEWTQCILVIHLAKKQWDEISVERKRILSEDEIAQINKAFVDCQNLIDNRDNTVMSLIGYYAVFAHLNKGLVMAAEKMGLNVRMINADRVVLATEMLRK